MKLIKRIAINSRNGDISALLSLILGALNKFDWTTDTYLTLVINETKEHNTLMTEALNRLRTYSQLEEKDHVRDLQIRSLFKAVEGYIHIPVADISEAAMKVHNILAQYGLDIQNEDNSTQSAQIRSMINDLAKADIVVAISRMQGVAQIVTNLTKAEDDFEAVTLQQAESEGARNDLATATKLKKLAVKELNDKLVGYLNTMAKVRPDTYEAIAQTIAELIDNNNELVKRRRTANENEADTN
jgi:hypothetical protein